MDNSEVSIAQNTNGQVADRTATEKRIVVPLPARKNRAVASTVHTSRSSRRRRSCSWASRQHWVPALHLVCVNTAAKNAMWAVALNTIIRHIRKVPVCIR